MLPGTVGAFFHLVDRGRAEVLAGVAILACTAVVANVVVGDQQVRCHVVVDPHSGIPVSQSAYAASLISLIMSHCKIAPALTAFTTFRPTVSRTSVGVIGFDHTHEHV